MAIGIFDATSMYRVTIDNCVRYWFVVRGSSIVWGEATKFIAY